MNRGLGVSFSFAALALGMLALPVPSRRGSGFAYDFFRTSAKAPLPNAYRGHDPHHYSGGRGRRNAHSPNRHR